MDFQFLGSLGELIAAVATVVTLLYLTIQIRQNTRALRASSAREVIFNIGEWHKANVSSPEMLKHYHKSIQAEMPEFTPDEWNEMNSYCKSLFHILEAQYVHSRFGVGTGDAVEPHLRGARTLIEQFPVWRKFWEEESRSGHWTQGFAEEIARLSPGSLDFADSDK